MIGRLAVLFQDLDVTLFRLRQLSQQLFQHGHGDQAGAAAGYQKAVRLQQSDAVGNVVVARAPLALRTPALVWGPRPALRILQTLKSELDPAGILGAGRGPS